MNLGGTELLIVIALAVLIFGGGWLPKAARNLGKAKVEFDEAQRQLNETKDKVIEASGIQELEATVRKANKALNTTPQGLIKGAAASAMKPTRPGAEPELDADAVADAVDDGEGRRAAGDNIYVEFDTEPPKPG